MSEPVPVPVPAPAPQVVPVRRKNDINVTFDKLQAQLLRSCKPAGRKLARAAKGRSDFRNDLELRACLGLARIAADLLYGRTLKAPQPPQPRSEAGELERQVRRYLRGRGS